MAVPTITSVSPSTGPVAGGNYIEITGTNFKTPTPAYAIPVADATPTVLVYIGGVACGWAYAVSATKVRAVVPRFVIDPRANTFTALAIQVKNCSTAGVPITGETASLAAAYTYARPALGAPRKDPPILKVAMYLVKALSTEIERNTALGTHIDYGEEGSAIIIDEAKLPSVNIRLDVQPDVEYSEGDNYPEEVEQLDGTASIYEGRRTDMLVCNVVVAGEGIREALFLKQAVDDFATVNPLLPVPCDQDLYPGLTDDYYVESIGSSEQVGAPNDSSVICYTMTLRVRGITVLMDQPRYSAKKITDFIVAMMHMDDSTATPWPF